MASRRYVDDGAGLSPDLDGATRMFRAGWGGRSMTWDSFCRHGRDDGCCGKGDRKDFGREPC
jgi:hypothetical protein